MNGVRIWGLKISKIDGFLRLCFVFFRSKPIVDRRLQRELIAKVAMRNKARQTEGKAASGAHCSSTYSNASTITLESRR